VFPSVWRIGDPVLRAMEARRLICATSVIGEAMAILGGLPPCDREPIGMGASSTDPFMSRNAFSCRVH
jgi:hypothetical protein